MLPLVTGRFHSAELSSSQIVDEHAKAVIGVHVYGPVDSASVLLTDQVVVLLAAVSHSGIRGSLRRLAVGGSSRRSASPSGQDTGGPDAS